MKSSEIMRWLRQISAELLLTEQCVACHQRSHQALCSVCLDDISHSVLPYNNPDLLAIPKIANRIQTSNIDRLVVATDYVYPMTMMISGIKFRHQLYQARALGQVTKRFLIPHLSEGIECLMPVPLSAQRLASRHFNQAFQMAKTISDETRIPLQSECVDKVKHIPAQSTLSGVQRRHNSRGAYKASGVNTFSRVAVFDDVITTGSTVNAVAGALKAVNPDLRVEVYCVCISLLHQ